MTRIRVYPKHLADQTPVTATIATTKVSKTKSFVWGNQATINRQLSGGRMAILDMPAPGSVLQSDGKYALNLGDVVNAETRTFINENGQQVTLEIAARKQLAGWGEGTHYMLERDPATEDLIIEPGRNHRKLYVTAGAHGYTKADIVEEVGGGMTEAQVTNAWLKAQSVYGGSPAKALDAITGVLFWNYITANKQGVPANLKQSNWLLLERGYRYDMGSLASAHFMPEGIDGESQLHPAMVGAYGTGKEPILGGVGPGIRAFGAKNVAFVGVSQGGESPTHQSGQNIIYADLRTEPGPHEITFSTGTSFRTVYRCMMVDIHRFHPGGTRTDWRGENPDRISGMYSNGCQHLLIEDPFSDHNGWKDGYVPGSTYAQNPNQPPTIYSHDFYLSWENRDVTLIGGMISRGSSLGYQMRSGGRVIDNLLIDNNQHGTEAGGGVVTEGIPSPRKGNYTLLLGNVGTSAGYKTYENIPGAKSSGIDVQSGNVVALDNIICHRADPANPTEQAAKPSANKALWVKDYTPTVPTTELEFDNTIHWNWEATNKNVEGLNETALNNTTIQKFAATKLPEGTAPTIPNFMAWMRERTPRERQLIQREALAFFRTPYDPKLELPAVKRSVAANLVFRPDSRCEGFLWENRMNWSTGDLPGTVAADTVNLFGNFVRFNRLTVTTAVTFAGGTLDVVSGKLTNTAATTAAKVTVRNSGQYFAAANGNGDYIASGGRLVFTGAATVDLEVAGEAECLLGPNLTIRADGELTIYGGDCWAGWDGTGTRTATGPLAFVEAGGKVGKLQVFKRRGDDPEPTVTATYPLTALRIDVTTPGTYDLGGGAGTGVTYTNPGNITLPAGVTLSGGKLTLVVS